MFINIMAVFKLCRHGIIVRSLTQSRCHNVLRSLFPTPEEASYVRDEKYRVC